MKDVSKSLGGYRIVGVDLVFRVLHHVGNAGPVELEIAGGFVEGGELALQARGILRDRPRRRIRLRQILIHQGRQLGDGKLDLLELRGAALDGQDLGDRFLVRLAVVADLSQHGVERGRAAGDARGIAAQCDLVGTQHAAAHLAMLDLGFKLQPRHARQDRQIVDPLADIVQPDDAHGGDGQREGHGKAAQQEETLAHRDRLADPGNPLERRGTARAGQLSLPSSVRQSAVWGDRRLLAAATPETGGYRSNRDWLRPPYRSIAIYVLGVN